MREEFALAPRCVKESIWQEITGEFTPRFLALHPRGGVVPISTTLMGMPAAAAKLDVPFIARAGSGVIHAHYPENPPEIELHGDFATMVRVKEMFDPEHLLNRGRMYGRI